MIFLIIRTEYRVLESMANVTDFQATTTEFFCVINSHIFTAA